ncbi:hypothetical protein KKD88_00140, partial [Patescibacteria group bacterium]|nr:hypothetical protein [Patescibacteria group bacterium]MBU1629473.1 hypothetical protein [Patescibacteria group bacterium]
MVGNKFNKIFRQAVAVVFIVAQTNLFGALSFFALAPIPAHAEIPTTIGYQGRLKDAAGTALTG